MTKYFCKKTKKNRIFSLLRNDGMTGLLIKISFYRLFFGFWERHVRNLDVV